MNTTISSVGDLLTENQFLILIPKNNNHGILEKSGVVAKKAEGSYQIDYEGNIYEASNVETWEEKILHAAGRAAKLYPTVARCFLLAETVEEDFEIVGILNYGTCVSLLKERKFSGNSENVCVQKSLTFFRDRKNTIQQWTQ